MGLVVAAVKHCDTVVVARDKRQDAFLEGGIVWEGARCTCCGKAIQECPNDANKFNERGEYEIFFTIAPTVGIALWCARKKLSV